MENHNHYKPYQQSYNDDEVEDMQKENEKLTARVSELEEELNNSKLFHCPYYLTTDNGYVACRNEQILTKDNK